MRPRAGAAAAREPWPSLEERETEVLPFGPRVVVSVVVTHLPPTFRVELEVDVEEPLPPKLLKLEDDDQD